MKSKRAFSLHDKCVIVLADKASNNIIKSEIVAFPRTLVALHAKD
jgi:hypothetical protein